MAGATSGGGAQNSAWALTSGHRAGTQAASIARAGGRRSHPLASGVGQAGLRPRAEARSIDHAVHLAAIQSHTIDYGEVLWRDEWALDRAAARLDAVWQELSDHAHEPGLGQVRTRELAAMAATARWCVAAAGARRESRGMHNRIDHPAMREDLAHRLIARGIDVPAVRPERARPADTLAA